MIDALNKKSLEERQREVDEKLLAALGSKVYEGMQKSLKKDALQWIVLPSVLGRDLWELFWGTYRDTIESQAEKALTAIERSKDKKPSIFDGL